MQTKNIDYSLFFVVLALVVFGMIMISSVSVYPSFKVTSLMVESGKLDAPNNHFYLLRNISHVLIGIFLFAVVAKTPYTFFEKHAKTFFLGGLVLLISVLFVGVMYNGARGWINIPLVPFSLQPVEFMKLGLVLYFAAFLKKKRHEVHSLKDGFIPYMALLFGIIFLLALQPDFGSILLIVPIAVGMFFVGGWNIRHLAVSAVVFALFASSVYAVGNMEDSKLGYVSERIDNFFSDNKTAIQNQSINFQSKQGLIAIGSGGIAGLGFWKSVQKFGYLPEVQGDFIFSVIAEELGFIGVVILLSAYGFIGYRAFRLSEQVEDPFAKYVSIGVGLWILTQASVNIGVNLNILPLTGITLPFVSYGGSSLLSLLIASGILLNISRSARVVDTRGNSYKNTPFERRRSLTDMRA